MGKRAPTLDDVQSGRVTIREYFTRSPVNDDDASAHLTSEQSRQALLDALDTVPTLTEACRIVGVSKQTVWVWRKADPAYDAAVMNRLAVAQDDYADALEQAAWRRAMHEMSPAYNGTPITGYFVLKRLKPQYRDTYTETPQMPQERTIRFLTPEESAQAIEAQYRLLDSGDNDSE